MRKRKQKVKRGGLPKRKTRKRKSAKRQVTSPVKRSRSRVNVRKRKAAPKSLKTRLDEHARSVEALGIESLANGRILIGATNWITPDKRGLSRLSRMLRPISVRKLGDFSIYSFDLDITFNDRSGHPVNVSISKAGVPRLSERDKKKYGKKHQVIFNRKIRRIVTRKIFQAFAENFPYPNKVIKKLVPEREAKRIIEGIKKKRNTKLRFILYRDIHAADKRKHLSSRIRHGGRFKGKRKSVRVRSRKGKRDI